MEKVWEGLVRLKCPNSPVMVRRKYKQGVDSAGYNGMYQCFWWVKRDEEFKSEWFFPEMLEEVEVREKDNGMGGRTRKIILRR